MKKYSAYIQKLLFCILAAAVFLASPMFVSSTKASGELPARFRLTTEADTSVISKNYSIVYVGYQNCRIRIDKYSSVSNWNVVYEGNYQSINTFFDKAEEKSCALVLKPGLNNIVLEGRDTYNLWTYKISLFYVPEETPAAKKNAVKNAISAADSRSTNEASYAAGIAEVNAAWQMDAISMYDIADQVDMSKHYNIFHTSLKNFKIAVSSSNGYAVIRKNGTVLHTGVAGKDFKIESELDNGANWYQIDLNKEDGVVQYEICIFKLTSIPPQISQLIINEITNRNKNVVDKTSYDEGIKYVSKMININKAGKVKAIDAGERHALALMEDGTVIAWSVDGSGSENKGQWYVPDGLKDVKAVAAGGLFSLALKEDGTVVAWGDNSKGQCNVPEGLTGVKAISAGTYHALALKEDGTVVAWGAGRINTNGLVNVVAVQAGKIESAYIMGDGRCIYDGLYKQISENRKDFKSVVLGGFDKCYTVQNDNTLLNWSLDEMYRRPEYCRYFGWTNVDSASASYDEDVILLYKDGTIGYFSDDYLNTSKHKELFPSVSVVNPVQVKCTKNGDYYLALQADGMVVAWNRYGKQASVPKELYRNYAMVNGMIMKNSYNILYYENDPLNIEICSDFGGEVKVNGTTVKTIASGKDTLSDHLRPGRNDVEITLNSPLNNKIYKVAVFYVQPSVNAAIRQNILTSVISANSRCSDENSFQSLAAALGNYKYFYISTLGVQVGKPFSIYYTESPQVTVELMNLTGTTAIYKDGAICSNTISLQRGSNEFEIHHEINGITSVYKVCLLYMPSSENALLRSLVANSASSANAQSNDETSYKNEINKLLHTKQIDIRGLTGPIPSERHHRVFISEAKSLQLALTAYQADAKIWINGSEAAAMTSSSVVLPLDFNQTINQLEVRFSEGQSEVVNKITIFYLPPETSAAFKNNVINEVIAADKKSIDDNTYREAVGNVVKNVRNLCFTDFVGAVDMNRPNRYFFTKNSQIALQTFCLEQAKLEYVKYSSRSDNSSGSQDLGILLNSTVINLNEGRNEIKILFGHPGQEKVYRFCIIRGKSSFGDNTTNDIISKVISADNAMDGTEGTYNGWLGTVSNCYYDWQSRWLTNWWW